MKKQLWALVVSGVMAAATIACATGAATDLVSGHAASLQEAEQKYQEQTKATAEAAKEAIEAGTELATTAGETPISVAKIDSVNLHRLAREFVERKQPLTDAWVELKNEGTQFFAAWRREIDAIKATDLRIGEQELFDRRLAQFNQRLERGDAAIRQLDEVLESANDLKRIAASRQYRDVVGKVVDKMDALTKDVNEKVSDFRGNAERLLAALTEEARTDKG